MNRSHLHARHLECEMERERERERGGGGGGGEGTQVSREDRRNLFYFAYERTGEGERDGIICPGEKSRGKMEGKSEIARAVNRAAVIGV